MTIEEKRAALLENCKYNIAMALKDLKRDSELLAEISAEIESVYNKFGVNLKYFRKNGKEYTIDGILNDIKLDTEYYEKSVISLKNYKFGNDDLINNAYTLLEIVMT